MAFGGGIALFFFARAAFAAWDQKSRNKNLQSEISEQMQSFGITFPDKKEPAISEQKDRNDEIVSRIASVSETNQDMRQKLTELAKLNAAKREGLRNAYLRDKLANLTARNRQLSNKVYGLWRNGQAISGRTKKVRSENDALKDSLKEVREFRQVSKSMNDELAVEVANVSEQARFKKKQYSNIAKENKERREELSQVKQHQYDLMRQTKHEVLMKKLANSTNRADKISASVERIHDTKKFLDKRIDGLRSSTAGSHVPREYLQSSEKVTKESNDKVAAELAKLDADNKDMKMQMAKLTKENLEKKHEILTNKLSISSERKKNITAGVESLQNVNQVLSERTDELVSARPHLSEKSMAWASTASTAEVKQQNADIAASIAAKNKNSKHMRMKIGDLATQNNEMRTMVLKGKLEGSKERSEQLSSAVEHLKDVNKDLADRVHRARR